MGSRVLTVVAVLCVLIGDSICRRTRGDGAGFTKGRRGGIRDTGQKQEKRERERERQSRRRRSFITAPVLMAQLSCCYWFPFPIASLKGRGGSPKMPHRNSSPRKTRILSIQHCTGQ
ncbi:hypothetical protein B0O80DRAFT_127802 [Mortierella sp. GBAus27b]|nr:hypothetical protein B0O80DRAFT_127802 [Mortierella sp. GBAus27b]